MPHIEIDKDLLQSTIKTGLLSKAFLDGNPHENEITEYYTCLFHWITFQVGSFDSIYTELTKHISIARAVLEEEIKELKLKIRKFSYSVSLTSSPTEVKNVIRVKYTSFTELKQKLCCNLPLPPLEYSLYYTKPAFQIKLTEEDALETLSLYLDTDAFIPIRVKQNQNQSVPSAESVLNPYRSESRFNPKVKKNFQLSGSFTPFNSVPASFSAQSLENIHSTLLALDQEKITTVIPNFGDRNLNFKFLFKAFSLPYDIHKLLEPLPEPSKPDVPDDAGMSTSTSQKSLTPPSAPPPDSQTPLKDALQNLVDLLFNEPKTYKENNILPFFVMSLLPITMNNKFASFKTSIHFHSDYQNYVQLFDIISPDIDSGNPYYHDAFFRLRRQKSDFALIYKIYALLIFEFKIKYENLPTPQGSKAKKTKNTLVHQELLNTNNPSRQSLWKMTCDKFHELISSEPKIPEAKIIQELSKLFVLHGLVDSDNVLILKLRLMNLKHLIQTRFLGTCAWDIPFCSYENVGTFQSRNIRTFWGKFRPLVPQLYQVFATLKDTPSGIVPKIPFWAPTQNKDDPIESTPLSLSDQTMPFSLIHLLPLPFESASDSICIFEPVKYPTQELPFWSIIPLHFIENVLQLAEPIPNISVFTKTGLTTSSWFKSESKSAHMMIPFTSSGVTLFVKCRETSRGNYYPNSIVSESESLVKEAPISVLLQGIPWKDLPGKPSPIFAAQLSYYARTTKPITCGVWCEAALFFGPDTGSSLSMTTFWEKSKSTFLTLVNKDPNNLTLLFQGLIKQVERLHMEKLIHGDIVFQNILVVPKPENFPENQIFNVSGTTKGKMYGMILIDFTHSCEFDKRFVRVRRGLIHPQVQDQKASACVDFYSIMIFLKKIIGDTFPELLKEIPSTKIWDKAKLLEVVTAVTKKLSAKNNSN